MIHKTAQRKLDEIARALAIPTLGEFEEMERDAVRLALRRGGQRRFRQPLRVSFFDAAGALSLRIVFDGSRHECILEADDRGEPNSITIEDSRGRRAVAIVQLPCNGSIYMP